MCDDRLVQYKLMLFVCRTENNNIATSDVIRMSDESIQLGTWNFEIPRCKKRRFFFNHIL